MSAARTLIFMIGIAVFCGHAHSQVASTAPPERPSDGKDIYKETANQIAKANPKVNPQTLQYDLSVVQRAEPKLRERYPVSFSDADVQHIATQSWMDFRTQHPNDKLDLDKFAKLASESYGGLKVTSTPNGAAIEVDSRLWDDPTNAQSSCRTGTRHIKLSKPGYDDAEGDAVVVEGQWTLFHKDLKKK
jgi:PEGA domain-containing protein